MYTYRIYKALGASVVFKGIAGRFIWWLGIAFVLLLLLFAWLYLLGVALWICIILVTGIGTSCFLLVSRLSKKYGEDGLMKQCCQRHIPKKIKGFYFQ